MKNSLSFSSSDKEEASTVDTDIAKTIVIATIIDLYTVYMYVYIIYYVTNATMLLQAVNIV